MVLTFFALAILGGLFVPLPALPRRWLRSAPCSRRPSRRARPAARSRAARPRPWTCVVLVAWTAAARDARDVGYARRASAGGLSRDTPARPRRAGDGRRGARSAFVGATLFFWSRRCSRCSRPAGAAGALLLLAGWAIFASSSCSLLRRSPFDDRASSRPLAVAIGRGHDPRDAGVPAGCGRPGRPPRTSTPA